MTKRRMKVWARERIRRVKNSRPVQKLILRKRIKGLQKETKGFISKLREMQTLVEKSPQKAREAFNAKGFVASWMGCLKRYEEIIKHDAKISDKSLFVRGKKKERIALGIDGLNSELHCSVKFGLIGLERKGVIDASWRKEYEKWEAGFNETLRSLGYMG